MGIPYVYTDVSKRLAQVRAWADSVTEGNRCAMVVGQALLLKPSGAQESMYKQPFVAESSRQQPFAKKFFVKAWDLTEAVLDTWGPASVRIKGTNAESSIADKKGYVYLEDCWQTPTEKMNNLLFGVDVRTGDHADLWNGKTLEIYPHRSSSLGLFRQSRMVWFWECTPS